MVHRSTVWQWGKDDYKRIENSGKGNAGTKVEVDRKVECLEKNRTLTVQHYADKLAERGTQKSKSAVERWLKARGLTWIKAVRNPVLTEANKKARVAWGEQ